MEQLCQKEATVMSKRNILIALLALFTAGIFSVAISPDSMAFNQSIIDGANAARGTDQMTDLFGASGIFTTVTNILLFVIGAISVIMIIIGGLRYVISGGNTASVTAAKNTILYAVIGLVIALFAYAVINFVLTSFSDGAGGMTGGGGTDI